MGVDFNGNNTQATPQLVISIDETGITIVGKMNLIIIHSRATEGTVTEIIDQGIYDIMGESFETIIMSKGSYHILQGTHGGQRHKTLEICYEMKNGNHIF